MTAKLNSYESGGFSQLNKLLVSLKDPTSLYFATHTCPNQDSHFKSLQIHLESKASKMPEKYSVVYDTKTKTFHYQQSMSEYRKKFWWYHIRGAFDIHDIPKLVRKINIQEHITSTDCWLELPLIVIAGRLLGRYRDITVLYPDREQGIGPFFYRKRKSLQ